MVIFGVKHYNCCVLFQFRGNLMALSSGRDAICFQQLRFTDFRARNLKQGSAMGVLMFKKPPVTDQFPL